MSIRQFGLSCESAVILKNQCQFWTVQIIFSKLCSPMSCLKLPRLSRFCNFGHENKEVKKKTCLSARLVNSSSFFFFFSFTNLNQQEYWSFKGGKFGFISVSIFSFKKLTYISIEENIPSCGFPLLILFTVKLFENQAMNLFRMLAKMVLHYSMKPSHNRRNVIIIGNKILQGFFISLRFRMFPGFSNPYISVNLYVIFFSSRPSF